MANKESQRVKWQQALLDLGLTKSNDRVEEYLTANWATHSFAIFGTWRKGTLIFTEQKLIFMTTFGVNQFDLEYSDIREVKKSFAGLLPMAMTVTAYDKKTDKTKKYKLWITGRNKWIHKVIEKAGLAA